MPAGATQTVEFLSFSVNSLTQKLSLPSRKVKKIRADMQALLEGRQVSIRKLAQLLGKLQAATRAIPLVSLFHKLQRALQRGLDQSGQDYLRWLMLSPEEQEELQWWLDHLTMWNRQTIVAEKPSVVIESDTSTRGWGETCKGIRTGGPWSPEESQWHINCLEALVALHALKCFVRDRKSVCQRQETRLSETRKALSLVHNMTLGQRFVLLPSVSHRHIVDL